MIQRIISLLLLTLLIGSCAPASPSQPTPVPATQTFAPFETPSPTSTATPIPTHQTQEHLLVTRDNMHLIMLNANGSLYKSVQIPSNVFFGQPDDAVSSDGKWLVYELGSIDESYDYSLNLLNLHDETTLSIARLISPDFPENIEPIVETISQYDEAMYESNCCKDLKCLRSLIQDDVLGTVGSYDWSPDGQFLAFVAQIDGPSSDIYIYSIQDKVISRLTDDLQNTQRVRWSPNGKWQ